MNIFLPYENDIQQSVESLDDLRLNKQILETYQLLSLAIDESKGFDISKRGYRNHPIYLHYKSNIEFLMVYGYRCCTEWQYRFSKSHRLTTAFMLFLMEFRVDEEKLKYTPFYMEGSKGKSNCIRTTENVSELYQQKLINKWLNDKRQPKWTNREMPMFYKEYSGDNE